MSRAALCIALAACSPALDSTQQAIVGGQPSSPAEFPTVVALENSPGNWFCTGTLIDKDWVLTAAHCVTGETASTVRIRFDDANINDTTGGKVVAAAEVHGNPGFNDNVWDNDIAVVKLAESVTDRQPTAVHRDALAPGTMVTEVGYGDADNNGGGAGVLRKLVTPTVDCAMANDLGISNANLLCFDASDGTSSCYGDSGGPAFVAVGGNLEVAGVTSGGTGSVCTSGWDLYTSVPGEIAFVDQYVPMPGSGSGSDPGSGDGGGSDGPDPGHPGADHASCSAGGGSGGAVALAAVLVAWRRRRR